MEDNIGFFPYYITGIAGTFFLSYFFLKVLKREVELPFYFRCAVWVGGTIFLVPIGTMGGFAVFVLSLTVCGVLVCRADVRCSFLYAALMTEMLMLCDELGDCLTGVLHPLLSALSVDMAGILHFAVSEIFSLLLTVFCYYMLYRYFSGYTAENMPYLFLVFIPILMIFIMCTYINIIGYDFDFLAEVGPWPSGHLFGPGQLFVVHLLGIASLFCILFAYKKLLQNFRLGTELSLLEQQERSLNQYVEEARAHYEKTRSFRHDIKNHITVIKELLQAGKLEQAVSYIEDMDDMAEQMSFPCSTNNPVVDILVGNKLGIAKSMGINADCHLQLPSPCGLRDIDLCIVLSNALDNAIHACKNQEEGTEKYILVSGRIQGDFFMLEVENSCCEKDAVKTGTGLSNVKTVAGKYGGAMSIETRGHVFSLHVLLIIPQHPESISQQKD